MVGPVFRTVLSGSVTLFLLTGTSRAHIPDKIVVELDLEEDSWVARSEMDVKFAVVALMRHYIPPDTGSGWIDNLNPGQLGLVREVTEKLYRERLRIAVGAKRAEMEVDFPDYETSPVTFPLGENDEPMVRVVMRGTYPEDSGAMMVGWSGRWGPRLVLMVRSSGKTAEPSILTVELGEIVELEGRGSGGSRRSLPKWVGLGFLHLLPKGPEHILFLLGLFLLVPLGKPLLAQAIGFTVAHSLTFWLVMLGVFEVPPGIVAPFLALGIVYIGIENLFLTHPTAWRMGMVTGLGLVHGIGFAGVLQELSVPREGLLAPLAGFHLGVELGQVAVFGVALLLALPFLKTRSFGKIRTLGSALLAAGGLFLAVEHFVA